MKKIQGSEIREALIGVVFPMLRKAGLYARANYMCCGGCASYGLGQDMEAAALKGKPRGGAVYWHGQDDQRLWDDGDVYLGFGAGDSDKALTDMEVGELVVMECRIAGLEVEWDGTASQRIHVTGLAELIAVAS